MDAEAVRVQPKPPGRMVRIALIAGWGAVLGCLFVNAARRVGGPTGDFVHFFAAAQAMVHGQDIYTSGIGWYIYPPLLAFLYTPLVSLPPAAAAMVMLVCNMTLMVLSVFLATREFSRRFGARIGGWTTCAVALTAVLLTADKLKGELQMWQTNMLLLFLFTSALCLLDRRPGLAGLALGFAFNIKYWPIVLMPYLLLRRRWAAAAAFAASIVAFALLPAVETGWEVNLKDQAVAYRGLLRVVGLPMGTGQGANVPSLAAGMSVSIPSAAARLAGAGGSPAVGYAFAALVGLTALAAAAWLYRRNGVALLYRPDGVKNGDPATRAVVGLEWAGLLTAVLLFSPQTNPRHLSLLLFVQTAAALLLLCPRRDVARLPLLIGTIVLVLGLVLPPADPIFGARSAGALEVWRGVGGPCWCALAMLGALLWVGMRYARPPANTTTASLAARRSGFVPGTQAQPPKSVTPSDRRKSSSSSARPVTSAGGVRVSRP